MPVPIYIVHAPEDRDAATMLVRHLTPLIRAGKISIWHRDLPFDGDDVEAEAQRSLQSASIFVLLVSPDLEFHRDAEIELALAQRKRGARVIPVFYRHVELETTRYHALRMLPSDRPINAQRARDMAWVEVVRGIRSVVESFEKAGPSKNDVIKVSGSTSRDSLPLVQPEPAIRSATVHPLRILFIAANPADRMRIGLDHEVREIASRLKQSSLRERFELVSAWAVRPSDLLATFLEHKPTVVHFSGHGNRQGEIYLEDELGRSAPVGEQALARLFRVASAEVRCVVMSACYSAIQAETISQYIDCVVGVPDNVSDEVARAFSAGFYTALGAGKNLQDAFELGNVQIGLLGYRSEGQLKLFPRPGVDLSTVRLV